MDRTFLKKVFIEFVKILLLCFYVLVFWSQGMWDLCSPTRDQTVCTLYSSTNLYSLLLLLSCFSRVRPCATPQRAIHQAPLSLGFSRQEYWSGLPFPSPMHATSLQSCPTLCDPMDSSQSGSSVIGRQNLTTGSPGKFQGQDF